MSTKTKKVSVDKIYKLKNGSAPLSYMLPSRSTKRNPLLWFDEENGINRPIRYAINQRTAFEDEQDGNAIVEPIIFEDGFLSVPKNNPVLQEFLHYHPLNGIAFEEVDYEKDAAKELESLDNEVDALIRAKELTVGQLDSVYRILFNRNPELITTAEMKRDVLVFAKRDPRGFLNILDDPQLNTQAAVQTFFDNGLLVFKNQQKEIWFNTPSNKKKLMNIPFGADPYVELVEFFTDKAGIEALKMLESNLEMMQ
jgi:hypothetical protein